jgi:hypothetical protein
MATALKGLQPNQNRTANSVFRGEILLADGRIARAFIKDLDHRQFGNELLVAAIARRLNVPVPDAAIVRVPTDVSDQFRRIRNSSGEGFIAFGSIDAEGSTVAQVYEASGSLDLPSKYLRVSPVLGKLYGLDTWVANTDRHANNLIIRGDGQIFLIDHGHCLSGPTWVATDLSADRNYDCRLESWLTPLLSAVDKDGAMADIKSLMSNMIAQDIQNIICECLADQMFGANDSDAVVGFLEARVNHLEALAATALGTL